VTADPTWDHAAAASYDVHVRRGDPPGDRQVGLLARVYAAPHRSESEAADLADRIAADPAALDGLRHLPGVEDRRGDPASPFPPSAAAPDAAENDETFHGVPQAVLDLRARAANLADRVADALGRDHAIARLLDAATRPDPEHADPAQLKNAVDAFYDVLPVRDQRLCTNGWRPVRVWERDRAALVRSQHGAELCRVLRLTQEASGFVRARVDFVFDGSRAPVQVVIGEATPKDEVVAALVKVLGFIVHDWPTLIDRPDGREFDAAVREPDGRW
jgi:hypothetical protein